MLQLKNVKKYFGNQKAIDGVQLDINKGEIFCVIGQEGSGKTTLLQLAAGLLSPDEGQVYLDGKDIQTNTYESRLQIGYVPQHFQLYAKLKVREYMEFYAGFYPKEGIQKERWIQELLDLVQLREMEEVYVEKLSQGMSQRLCVAQALLSDPKVLILDEPGNGMDPRAWMEYRSLLKKLTQTDRTILISSHLLSDISDYCTSVGILEDGKFALKGSLDVILKKIKKEQPILIQLSHGEKQALEILRQHDKVGKVTLAEHNILAFFDGNEREEAELLYSLIQAGAAVFHFSRTNVNLENSFFQIISHQEDGACR